MTTEYYQIPSQQGLLPLEPSNADPWLAATTSSLSLSDWSVKGKIRNPPSLFESDDVQAVSWKHVVPIQFPVSNAKVAVRAPKTPKQFNSTASKIDAWSVVDNTVIAKPKKQLQLPQPQPQQPQQPQQQLQQPQPQPQLPTVTPVTEEAKPIEDELTHQNRYKTELCKSFTETGNCRYGVKCQFAHGKEEIRSLLRHPKYKTETCKTFHTTGTCPYGIRCRFIHTRSKEESIVTAVKPSPRAEEEDDCEDDEKVTINAPPGIPVPQWSKSWTMSLASAAPSKKHRHIADLSEPEPAF